MSQKRDDTDDVSAGQVVTLSSNATVAVVIFFFIFVLFFVILYLYAKHVWAPERRSRRRRTRSRRHVFALDSPVPVPRRGLDAAVLAALPVTVFRSEEFKDEDGLECAVCLCEVSDGEEVRLLPKCSHGFHLDCIDMWFHSHSTCPLCRSPVAAASSDDGVAVVVVDIPAPPAPTPEVVRESAVTTATSVASSSSKPDGMLVIEIPSRATMEGFRSPASTSSKGGDQETMKTPTSARRRSLMRMLSRGKRAMGSSPTTSTGGVADQGVAGDNNQYRLGLPPKTPKIL